MPDDNAKRLLQCLDREEIRNLLALYPRAVDRCDEALLRSIYWPDGVDDHGAFKGGLDAFVAWSFEALAALDQTHHHVGNPAIRLEGDRADSEAYYIAYHKVKADSGGQDFLVGGRYLDRLEKRNGEWRIARRVATFDYCTSMNGQDLSGFGFVAPSSIGGRKPDDPVYRLLEGQPPA